MDLDALRRACERLRHDCEVVDQTATDHTRWDDLHAADVLLLLDYVELVADRLGMVTAAR